MIERVILLVPLARLLVKFERDAGVGIFTPTVTPQLLSLPLRRDLLLRAPLRRGNGEAVETECPTQ
jgi:hypothetical protein